MEKINEMGKIVMEDFLMDWLNKLNNLVYKLAWPMIIIGLVIAAILILCNIKKYSYRYELSKWLKSSLFMMITGYLIKILDIKTIMPVFNSVFFNFIPVTFVGIIIGYLLDKIIFYKYSSNWKNETRYLKHSINLAYVFLLISSMYGIKEVISLGIFHVILISLKFLLENKENKASNSEINLYETRKKQLSILKDVLINSEYEHYAISINGEWGSGKSLLISALMDECRKSDYYYVYIKPMISDTQESLIREFQTGVSKLMKNNGIYNGRNSSLNKYFKEVLKLVQFNNKVTLVDFMELTSEESSYKDLKDELQEDINLLLSNGSKKLIVVIDDFDRVSEDKQLEILSFVEEVINFNGCVTIIALDYENLRDNLIVTPIYLEKFIATQIPLVDIEFDEIIKFHTKNILNESFLENDFSKKILLEVNNNINDYYKNIVNRIETYYKNRKDTITKSKGNDEIKKKQQEELDKLFDFAIDREKYNNNSRRVIHFLNEIKNTIILVDKLYKDRGEGQELLETVKVSEIIYFFNYIKVFYNKAYEYIVREKGIDEYLSELNRKNRKLEEEYFKVILGDIIPKNISIYGLFTDESKELNKINSLNLIKDLFINYHFTNNNIELLTNSEVCLGQIDNNSISISENFLDTIQVYQKAIFKHSNNIEQTTNRIKSLIKYVIRLYEEEKIDFVSILELATYKNNYRDMLYVKYYLKEACKLVDEGKINKLYQKDKIRIQSVLKDLEITNISQYRHIFVELLIISTLDINNDIDIDNLLKGLEGNNILFEKMKKYSIDNGLINEKNTITDLRELLNILLKQLKKKKYNVIDLELLNKRLEEFLLNYKYINKLNQIEIYINSVNLDRYKELAEYFNIADANEAKELIKDLAQKKEIDSDMMHCFQDTIKFIIRENAVDDECKSNIGTIFKKLKKEDCWNEYGWLDIMVNVERILNFKIEK